MKPQINFAIILLLSCSYQPEPEPEPGRKAVPVPESESNPTEPPPIPPKPLACWITIDGESILRALIITRSGKDINPEISNGRLLEFLCPPIEDRPNADLVVERKDGIFTAGVTLVATGDHIAADTFEKGIPDRLKTADKIILVRNFVNQEDGAFEMADDGAVVSRGEPAPPPPLEPVRVRFIANKLTWVELKIKSRTTKATSKAELDPTVDVYLQPGIYALVARREVDGIWESAGTINVESGKGKCDVKMFDAPLRASIACT